MKPELQALKAPNKERMLPLHPADSQISLFQEPHIFPFAPRD